jgi:hypothetical protein
MRTAIRISNETYPKSLADGMRAWLLRRIAGSCQGSFIRNVRGGPRQHPAMEIA